MAGIDAAVGLQWGAGNPFHDFVLTDLYLPVMVDALNQSAVLQSMIPSTSERIAGKYIVYPMKTGRSIGGTTIYPEGDLPDPSHQGYGWQAFGWRDYYKRLKVTGKIMKAAQLDAAAYLDAIEPEIQGAMDDIVQDWNRMLHNDGSGRLCEVVSVSTNDITVKINSGLAGATTITTAPTTHIAVGQRIAAIAANGTHHRTTTVTAIVDDDTFTVASGTSIVTGDWIVLAANETTTNINDTAFRTEPMGIGGVFNDVGVLDGNGLASGQTGSQDRTGTSAVNFQGAVVAGNTWNQAVVLDNGGTPRPITERLLQQAVSDCERRNNANLDVVMSGYDAYNDYVQLLVPDKRFNNTLELAGGHKVLSFNGLGWVKDKHYYGNMIDFLALDQFRRYECESLGWMDMDGSIWSRLQNKDAYQATMVARFNLGVDLRERCGGRVVDLL